MLIKLLKPHEAITSDKTLWIEPWGSGVKRMHLRPDSSVIRFDNCNGHELPTDLMPATEDDILKTILFAERFSKQDVSVGVWSHAVELGLAVTLGLGCWMTDNPRHTIATVMVGHLGQYPNEWVTELYDYCLGLSGSLVRAVEEYIVTGTIVTPDGKVLEAPY